MHSAPTRPSPPEPPSSRPCRREALAGLGLVLGSLAALPRSLAGLVLRPLERPFRISLAQWSLHRTHQRGELDPLDFPRHARESFGIEAVEYVSGFYPGLATDFEALGELRRRAAAARVESRLIMLDGEGELGASDDEARERAVERHFQWLAAARFLGCQAVRVNAHGDAPWERRRDLVAGSLRRLARVADGYGIDVLVENHGGLSSNGAWLAETLRAADHPRVGSLPDFGNFRIEADEWYDRYDGVRELMPFARAVSAKTYAFDARGDETSIDYERMLRIVLDAGYRGAIGIEYEGDELSEDAGIRATQALLERLRAKLAPEYA